MSTFILIISLGLAFFLLEDAITFEIRRAADRIIEELKKK